MRRGHHLAVQDLGANVDAGARIFGQAGANHQARVDDGELERPLVLFILHQIPSRHLRQRL